MFFKDVVINAFYIQLILFYNYVKKKQNKNPHLLLLPQHLEKPNHL